MRIHCTLAFRQKCFGVLIKLSIFKLYTMVDVCPINTACKNIRTWSFSWTFCKHSRHQVWQSYISLEGSIQEQCGLICILNVLGAITNCFQQFSCISLLYGCRICQFACFCQSVGDPSTGVYELICTFQRHSLSYGSVPLTTAFLYVDVLNKISSSS